MDKDNRIPFPYKFEELEPKVRTEVARLYKSPFMDFVSVGPKRYKVLRPYLAEAENIYNMPLRRDDVFVVSYQRSGTTCTQELVWLIANDLDYTTAANNNIMQRSPFIEKFMFFNKEFIKDFVNSLKGIESDDPQIKSKLIKTLEIFAIREDLTRIPSPRFFKTHIPLTLLPPSLLDTAKVVYIARDPRDVAVSSYHFSRLFKFMNFVGTFKEFWHLFINNTMTMAPYFEHIKEAWVQRDHPNMLFLFYEELLEDLTGTIERVADFLGKTPSTEELKRLCNHLHIDNFKNNAAVNYEGWRELGLLSHGENFIRKGKAGGWRDYFDAEMSLQAERWIAENLHNTDLRFPHLKN